MIAFALTGARVLTPGGWVDDHAVIVEGEMVAGVLPTASIPSAIERRTLNGGMLLPGFIDVQVNGGGGVLLNAQPTPEGVAAIAAAHRRFGTTALLPTLISDDREVIRQAIGAVAEAIAAGTPGVIGIHIEGPFLNERKRGIHDAAKFGQLDSAAIDLLSSLPNGVTLVTLAPELAGTGAIAELASRGVIVSAGHTMATYEDMQRAVEEGLTGVTHLFNAMTQMESRAPGVVGAALDLGLACGLIVDGHHVHPASLRAAMAAGGKDRMMLVTDAMPTVGMAEKSFTLGGRRIVAEGGACRASDGTLAGSDLDMAVAFRNAIGMLGVDPAEASRMASGNPARFLGLQQAMGTIEPGKRADLVHLDASLHPETVWVGGRSACA
jgi:N-acetylglucosamine-6-phosphate deacetylase